MRARLAATVAILLLGTLSWLAPTTARADPWTVNNGNGTSTAIWNFTTPADYTLVDTEIAGATASLAGYSNTWSTTTAADFAGPDSATNVDLARWPGNVTLATTSGPPMLVSLQPDPASGEDSWLEQANPNTNHGSDTTIVLDGFGPQSRPIVRFNISSLPAGAVIDRATLNLYQSAGVGATFTAYAVQVTAIWNEAQVTWNNRLTGTAWGTAGGDINVHVIGQTSLDNALGWRAWNVTVLVDLWYRGRLTNQGLLLAALSTGANADKTFFSSDYAVNVSRRPRLDISYRVLGTTGEYVSKVGGPGMPAEWQSISWGAIAKSLVADEFNGASLDPKWAWMNAPASEDVGTTTPGHLHVVSDTGVEFAGATFSGNLLWDQIVGDFNVTMKFSTNPTANGQKAGLMAMVDTWNWYGIQKRYDSGSGTVRWQIRATDQATTTTRVDVANANPIPAWMRLVRIGNSFQSWTSDDGSAWVLQDTYASPYEYPHAIRLGFFIADGASGVPLAVDVDYIRVSHGTDATVSVSTRTGDVSPVDGTWTGWSAAYPTPAGSAMSGSSRYIEFRLSFGVTLPDHTPIVEDVNLSWSARRLTGTVETRDLVLTDLAAWGTVSVVQTLNGQTIAYDYSLNGGSTWTAVSPPTSLSAASIATGRIRFRATMTATNPIVTPNLSEIRLTYSHRLDHFYVTASAAATAGSPFTVTITAKDAGNATLSVWTGNVALAPRLADGVTPGGGVLGTTTVTIVTGGSATLATETYTKAETIRIYASNLTATGLGGPIDVIPGPLQVPAWWQGNYLLAVPPIGAFVVVAMLAQRARWKPAKAFLVDDRNQMLREFTLDPSCRVTYDQAVQAGVLDAVEKPIKVTKYHGQTVRGDALAVVLLAYGPVTPEQVGFAREMLVQVQDKFDEALKQRLADVRAQETDLETRRTAIEAEGEALSTQSREIDALREQAEVAQAEIAVSRTALEAKEQDLVLRETVLADGRRTFEAEQAEVLEFKRTVDERVKAVEQAEMTIAGKQEELGSREAGIAPTEERLAHGAHVLVEREAEVATAEAGGAEKAAALEAKEQDLAARETRLTENRVVFDEARAALKSERREFEDRTAHYEEEIQRRNDDLDAQAKTVGERQLRLGQEKQTFDSARTAKDQALLSREIELEAREQSLQEKEEALRSRAEENGQRFSDLTSREQTLEIDAAKVDKARAELEARKGQLADLAAELDVKATQLREEEARRAEDQRTWQTTLESQQAVLKEQRELFENEASAGRESWAERARQIQEREDLVKDQEEKFRSEAEWVARTEEELETREKAVREALQSSSLLKSEGERLKDETEQRSLEVESKDRVLREESARQAAVFAQRAESFQSSEREIELKRADLEKEGAAHAEQLHKMELELQEQFRALEAKGRGLAEREARVATTEESLQQHDQRVQSERADLQAATKQLEARQLEVTQLRDHLESESARVRGEGDALRQSVVAKEAALHEERERIERDSAALQDTLGAKAKEMAAREKSITAREAELRSEEEDFEARMRELEAKERQAEARTTELSAQAMAFLRREQDLTDHTTKFQETVRKFEQEEATKRREWETLQENLRSQQVQFSATAESKTAEVSKRVADIDARERNLRAGMAQLEMDRGKLEAQAKAQSAKSAEAEAAWKRSQARLVELKASEDELLRARQSFESDRSTWQASRVEELKQLEATRDAAGVQAQQAEKLIGESQRRALVAEEAERAAKRRAEDLAKQAELLERRRSEADVAERDAQAHFTQIQEASRKLATKEMEIAASLKNLETRQAATVDAEKDVAAIQTELRARKNSLDQEAARLTNQSNSLTTRQREVESRTAALEANAGQVAKKEQTVTVELQRAEHLMEDLAKKEREVRTRDDTAKAFETELARREATLKARDTQLSNGAREMERLRREVEEQRTQIAEDRKAAATARAEAENLKRDAEKHRGQADAMHAEVSKDLRFLQKKALDILDQEEKLRGQTSAVEDAKKGLDARAEILEGKERSLETARGELDGKVAKLQDEVARLRTRLEDAEKGGGVSTAAADEWKKDVENRVKIIQKKAMELLDREEKLRAKEAELRALALQLGVTL